MKTIIQKTAILFMVAFSLGSCTRNDDMNPDGDLSGDLLLTESKIDDKMSARYEYDGQNRLVKLLTHDDAGVMKTTTTYLYDNKDRLTMVEMVNVEGEIEYTEIYTYGDGDRPTSSKVTFGSEDVENAIVTTYSYAGNVVVETADIPGGYTSEVTYTTDGKGNLVSIRNTSQGEWVSTVEFGDYDDKYAAGRVGNPYSWKFNSPNNYRSEKTTSSYAAGNWDRIRKYTYNTGGFPTKIEVLNREDNALVETYTYSYKSAK